MSTASMLPDDRRSLTLRLSVLQYLIAIAFAGLAVGFWIFQIAQHDKFEVMASDNHLRRLPRPAPRGVILDRDGKVLVENQNTFSIFLVREQTRDIEGTLRVLAAAIGADEAQLRDAVNRRRDDPSYRPIVLIENASREQVIAMRARRWELPGIDSQEVPSRRYPGDMAAHLFGYVGEVTESQMQRPDFEGVESGTIVGQAGVELAYNRLLMGKEGNKTVIVNSVGREISQIDAQSQDPVEGRRLQLTIDADVQKAVEDGFDAAGFNGAAVVLDPRNGEVLGFTSLPAFDPNTFAVGIDRATWNALNTDDLKPLQNRALQGRYSPGSLFKMAVGLAGLEEGVITPEFRVHCSGGANFYGRYFNCWKKGGGHGSIDLRHAIEQSCDVFFYTVGNMLGVDRIHKWATALGLGVKSGIDLPNELQGLVPSTEWKAQHTKEKKWYPGETISVAIGQGQVSVTPISLAVYAATLGNGGTRVTPHLVKATDDGSGWKSVPPPPPQSRVEVTPEKLQAIRDGMWLVVNGGAGTATRTRIPGKDVCGKTGTAQVISNQGRAAARTTRNLRDHGWFIFFAPRDNPQIAGAVFLEHGIHSANAASVARHILETYFAKKDGRPLPPPPTREDMHLDLRDPFARRAAAGVEGGQQ
ncbi:MAG: penicillin-binding protein 2 [Acidobacteria bacterium RIFCSPLOWO2_02_FULL_67_36]|nr:MAG: penicillin-binding protein 2 [Acidobacteria bacterium RIFCSPLOWO2_02_FULL_67_36]OFW21366.1 MAG: penicillin-binding protein 2 [Acidobacteria bacterium RIFCSPLOWO2_12_FULL_66_21]